MEEIIAEFQRRLDEQTNKEEPLHLFLRDNPILLAPDHIKCLFKPKFGEKYVPDFILVQVADYDEKCTLIEIEHAEHKLFTKNGDPTAELNHAMTQIDDWRDWLKLNAGYGKANLVLKILNTDGIAMLISGINPKFNSKLQSNLNSLTLNSNHKL